MRRTARQRVEALLVAVIACSGLLTVAPAQAADEPLDPYQPYEPQTRCEPTAQPGVVEFAALLLEAYPASGWSGISRDCGVRGTSEHKEGRAFDWAVSAANPLQRAAAQAALDRLLATDEAGNRHALFRRFGLMYIIWDRQVFRSYRPDEGWQPYSCDPGAGYDDCHVRHVHFSFSTAGAQRQTSWWTRPDAPTAGPDAGGPVAGAEGGGGSGGSVTSETSDASSATQRSVERIGDDNPVRTAVEVSRKSFPSDASAEHVFLANADAPNDAMVAAVLAGTYHGSLLLTRADDGAERVVDAEIRRVLGTSRDAQVVLVGGPGRLPGPAFDRYREDYDVRRVAGADDTATAVRAAELVEDLRGGRTAIVVSRSADAGALPMIAVAAANDWPVLFTGLEQLPADTRSFLVDRGITDVHVAGPPSVVSDRVVRQISALDGVTVQRHAGKDPAATSVAVAEQFFALPSAYAVATAQHWSDAVIGATYAGERRHAPLLLTDGRALAEPVADYLDGTDTPAIVVGSRNTVGAAVADALRGD